MYLLKLSLRAWRNAPVTQLFSSFAIGFLLILLALMNWVHSGMKPIMDRLQSEQVITAYLDPAIQKTDESQIVDSIRVAVGAKAVTEINVVSSEKFISDIKGKYPELGNELESLGGAELDALVPRYVSVTGAFQNGVLEAVRNVPGIESAESSRDRFYHIVGAFSALRWVARLFMAGLGLALLTGLIHLARVNSHLHQEVFYFLRLWGAHRAVTHVPAVFSGMSVGLLGGVLAASGWTFVGSGLIQRLRHLSPALEGMPMAAPHSSLMLFAAGVLLGTLAGFISSIWGQTSAFSVSGASGYLGRAGSGGRAWI